MNKNRSGICFRLSLVAPLCLFFHSLALATPKVVTSIMPVHSLVSGIMQGAGAPELLIRGAQSPHDFSLKPSDMRRLQHADLVIWVGPDVESSLARLLEKGHLKSELLTLVQMAELHRLPLRDGAEWEKDHGHDHHQTDMTEHRHDRGEDIDSHIWLSPEIARLIVSRVTELLCEMDEANASLYRRNSRQMNERLEQLDAQLTAMLSPVRDLPYVVFHDAYHYFERHYGLNAVGSVSVNAERQPGARHIHQLREKMARLRARCLFTEPQFRPKLVETLIEGSDIKTGQLDPLGGDLDAGPDAYFLLMRRLAANMLECLQ